jgi:hypothetical protein
MFLITSPSTNRLDILKSKSRENLKMSGIEFLPFPVISKSCGVRRG